MQGRNQVLSLALNCNFQLHTASVPHLDSLFSLISREDQHLCRFPDMCRTVCSIAVSLGVLFSSKHHRCYSLCRRGPPFAFMRQADENTPCTVSHIPVDNTRPRPWP